MRTCCHKDQVVYFNFFFKYSNIQFNSIQIFQIYLFKYLKSYIFKYFKPWWDLLSWSWNLVLTKSKGCMIDTSTQPRQRGALPAYFDMTEWIYFSDWSRKTTLHFECTLYITGRIPSPKFAWFTLLQSLDKMCTSSIL